MFKKIEPPLTIFLFINFYSIREYFAKNLIENDLEYWNFEEILKFGFHLQKPGSQFCIRTNLDDILIYA
jgi:hypothetical protein